MRRGGRRFPIDIWAPDQAGEARPLVIFSHSSGGNRRSSTFLCEHLASHGYVVAALDHSEVVAPGLSRRESETPDRRSKRVQAIIASRVPDVRFLLDHMLVVASKCASVSPRTILCASSPVMSWPIGSEAGGIHAASPANVALRTGFEATLQQIAFSTASPTAGWSIAVSGSPNRP
jgi:Platelet-activating factor acetylhydrolase, isoform II